LDRTARPSETTAAAVSSQEVSIPRTCIAVSGPLVERFGEPLLPADVVEPGHLDGVADLALEPVPEGVEAGDVGGVAQGAGPHHEGVLAVVRVVARPARVGAQLVLLVEALGDPVRGRTSSESQVVPRLVASARRATKRASPKPRPRSRGRRRSW
jgi:hypothetical protein